MVGGNVESLLAMTYSACFAAGQGGFDFADLDTPLFLASNPFDGGYALTGVLPGRYRLRYRAPGFDDQWYPGAATATDAQVVEVKPKSVVLREIAGSREYTHWAAGRTLPERGAFIGEPFRVNLQVSVYRDGEAHVYLPARFGSYYPWTGGAVGFSEYA